MEERARLNLEENEITRIKKSGNLKDIPLEPFKTNCESCGRNIVTCVKKEYNLLIFPYAIAILILYGLFYGMIILAITFLLFQNLTHICPECYCEITYKSFYPIQKKNNYYSLTFGKCTLVVKKIIINTIIICVALFGIYLNITSYIRHIQKSKNLEKEMQRNDESLISTFYNDTDKMLTWETLIKECGSKVMVENTARAIEIFNKKYYRKIVHWKGFFINAFINQLSQIGMGEPNHLVNFNIRMIPSESLKSQDLVLSMGRSLFLKHYKVISQMKTGTPIEFKAEFESIGDEWRPHHLHLISINLTDDFMKGKVNVTLFKGVQFDIKGHNNIKKEIEKIEEEQIITSINENTTFNLKIPKNEKNINNNTNNTNNINSIKPNNTKNN